MFFIPCSVNRSKLIYLVIVLICGSGIASARTLRRPIPFFRELVGQFARDISTAHARNQAGPGCDARNRPGPARFLRALPEAPVIARCNGRFPREAALRRR